MLKSYLYLNLLFLLFVIPLKQVKAQQNDFQCWPSVKVNLEIIKNLKLHVEEELRLYENCSMFSKQINDIGISYRFNKLLKAGIFYRLEADWKNADEYTWRNGLYIDLTAGYEVQRFSLAYRLRIQSAKVEQNNETNLFSRYRHRHKLSIEYNVKGIPLFPFIETELFVDKPGNEKSLITGFRSWVGLTYALNKRHAFTLKYGIDQELNKEDPLRAYIISAGYSVDLKLKH